MGRSECSKEGASGRRRKERFGGEARSGREMLRRMRAMAMADSWGQSSPEHD